MAELTKKLHFLKNGTEQTAKAYSTTGEAGSAYIPSKIDGVNCYIPIGSTSDAMATNGRVIKGGTTYAIKSQAKPPYTEISYTTAGTYTFTVPAGVTRMRVAVCGGGGASAYTMFPYVSSGNGGTSKFGELIQATGGGGGRANHNGDTGTASAGSAGTPNGNAGTTSMNNDGSRWYSGGAGFELSFTKTSGSYGKGGDAYGYYYWAPCGTGGSGGYNSGYVTVSPGTTYTITVGAGGKIASNSEASAMKDGNSGFVFIAYGGDI